MDAVGRPRPEPMLADLTTLGVGGPAARIVTVSDTEALVDAARETWADGEDWLVLGGGSNLLVADDGFDGTVLLVRTRGVEVLPGDAALAETSTVRIRVAAGEDWDDLVRTTVERGWSGLEALSGIPGTVGASPVQNVGAYGVEVADVVEAIDFLDEESGDRMRIPATDLGLGYRTSTLKRGRRGVVLAVEFTLRRADPEGVPVRYAQLADSLGVGLGERVAPAAVRDAVLGLRRSKGMVLDDADADTRSAGSFFTNPIVSGGFAETLPPEAPRWSVAPEPEAVAVPLGTVPRPPAPASDDHVKLSAAWLIEHAGVHRGFALPGAHAGISTKHTLALTNRGGASAAEVAELARYVQTVVMARFGVGLVPEPMVVGDLLS